MEITEAQVNTPIANADLKETIPATEQKVEEATETVFAKTSLQAQEDSKWTVQNAKDTVYAYGKELAVATVAIVAGVAGVALFALNNK